MSKTDHDYYQEEYALWRREQEIRIRELKRMIDDADEVKAINTRMLELATERLAMADEQHEKSLKDREESANE